MRLNKLSAICVMAALMAIGFGCQKESLVENGDPNGPALQGAVGDACSTPFTVGFADANGNQDVDFCVSGNTQVPCTQVTPWGTVTATKVDAGYPNSVLKLDVQMSGGWFSNQYAVIAGPCGTYYPTNVMVPIVDNNWTVVQQVPAANFFTIEVPMPNFGAECVSFALVLNVSRLNFFGAPITGSARTLYAFDNTGPGSPFVIDHNYEGCTPPSLTITKGNCQGCRSRVSVTFNGCNSVDISACKQLRRVVVVYDDCSRQVFNHAGMSASYTAPSGKSISHVIVRSGCRVDNNDDDDDCGDHNDGNNGIRNFRRFKFEGPCLNASCN